ncbi:BTB domain-containing protein [Mycena kentingensis (nom. inval.)]|nr:BTB domain-containing protein [Mycena kentingensis (nom. inval.)]
MSDGVTLVPCERCNSNKQQCKTEKDEKDCKTCKPLKVKCERKFDPVKINGVMNNLTGMGIRASGGHGASNPMGIVFKLQEGHHMNEYREILRDGNKKAAANHERAIVHEKSMTSPQMKAADMRYGANGIDKSNGFEQDKDGKTKYVGSGVKNVETVLAVELPKLLNDADKICCLSGHTRLTACFRNTPLKCLLNTEASGCGTPKECAVQAKKMLTAYLDHWQTLHVARVLAGWNERWDIKFCVLCRAYLKTAHEVARAECWEKLPSYFGLPPWDELLRMDLE